ncbi:hydrothetical protein [Palaeococcus pacificus DY20341]|uniref:Hydrothetical protein n=1 Tax=Palaeococcus pacificus DY20341 TaxID=1343739 RepID=A0A075LSV8_9EURY|nr:ASCH domain-containing protein [Palaeococcus pacificus]AIF69047.1 hydrothetical protein [Palaeococcus pacificus DY20341]
MRKVQIRKFMLIDSAYKSKILKGKKTTTIRFGKYEAKPGNEIYIVVRPSDTAIAKAKIKGITRKKVGELTNEDAKKDGFSDVRELMRALNKIYGELHKDDEVSIIEFELIKPLEGIPLKLLKGLNYKEPDEVAKLYVESGVSASRDVDLIVKHIYENGLKSALKRYGPMRVKKAVLDAYHKLYAEGII